MNQRNNKTNVPKPSRQASDIVGNLADTLREAEEDGRATAMQRIPVPYNVFTGYNLTGSNLIGSVARGWPEGGLISMGAIKNAPDLFIKKGARSVVLSIPSPRYKMIDLPPEKHYLDRETGEMVTQIKKVAGVNFRSEPYFNLQDINDADGITPALNKEQRMSSVDPEALLRHAAEAAGITCLPIESGKPSYQVASDEIHLPPNNEDSSKWVCDMARALFEGVSAPLRENRWSVLKEPSGELMPHPEADDSIFDEYQALIETQGPVAASDFLEGIYRDQLLRRELFVTTIASLTGSDYTLDSDPSLSADVIEEHYAPVPGAAFTGKILSNASFSGMVSKLLIDFAEGNDPGKTLKWFPPKSKWPEAAKAFNDTGIDHSQAAIQATADKLDTTPEEVAQIQPGAVPVEREISETVGALPPMPATKEERKEVLRDSIAALANAISVPTLKQAAPPPPSDERNALLRSMDPFG